MLGIVVNTSLIVNVVVIDSLHSFDFGTTPTLPPLRDGTGQANTEETDAESTKRLELIKAARSARPIPIEPSPPSGMGPGKNKKTQNKKGEPYRLPTSQATQDI